MQLSAIKQMEFYAQKTPDVISLSQGIPYTRTDPVVVYGAMKAAMAGKVDAYSAPQGISELRHAISQKLFANGMSYHPDEILITAGAVEAMSATLLSCITPGDEILIPTPTYSAFLRIANMTKAKTIALPLANDKEWQLDKEIIKKSITKKTKAIILCNPNNPTGSLYEESFLTYICQLAQENNFFVVLDEVYRNIVFERKSVYTPAVENGFRKNIIRIVSFSKDFSLTGWRIGFLHADKEIVESILPIHDNLVNCAPVISQYAALSALEHEKRILREHLTIYQKQRKIMGNSLESLSEFLSFFWPEASYFFFPKVHGVTSSKEFCVELLQKARLAVVPGSEFGLGGEGHIRLCFGRSEKNIIEGMKRLQQFFQTSYAKN